MVVSMAAKMADVTADRSAASMGASKVGEKGEKRAVSMVVPSVEGTAVLLVFQKADRRVVAWAGKKVEPKADKTATQDVTNHTILKTCINVTWPFYLGSCLNT